MIIKFPKATIDDVCLYIKDKGNGLTAMQLTGGTYNGNISPFTATLRRAASKGYLEVGKKDVYGKSTNTYTLSEAGEKHVRSLIAHKNKKIRSIYFCVRKMLRESDELLTSLEISKAVKQNRKNVIAALRQLESDGVAFKYKDCDTDQIVWGIDEE